MNVNVTAKGEDVRKNKVRLKTIGYDLDRR